MDYNGENTGHSSYISELDIMKLIKFSLCVLITIEDIQDAHRLLLSLLILYKSLVTHLLNISLLDRKLCLCVLKLTETYKFIEYQFLKPKAQYKLLFSSEIFILISEIMDTKDYYPNDILVQTIFDLFSMYRTNKFINASNFKISNSQLSFFQCPMYVILLFSDPCILSTQMELDEAVRLYELNKDSELTIHGKLKTSSSHFSTNLIKFSTYIGHYNVPLTHVVYSYKSNSAKLQLQYNIIICAILIPSALVFPPPSG
ncbi:atypical protein kinase C-like [Aphis craccivora]|uniref:Atypical protein kinase C-like n=1 Tax=Aphis craccivora TaxID=307492 RepID=A0A6G0ZCB1_APHCR|nr:atypical protein kinase C-like [Aphis craccivora]